MTTKTKQKFYARVSFYTEVIEVADEAEAFAKVDDLIQRLGTVRTRISWDDADFVLEKVQEDE